MANETRYYKTPFGESGNKAEVPDVSVGGAVGYNTGFGPDYELPQGAVGRKRIERPEYNGVMNSVTGNLKQWQESLYPTWIEDNGDGVPFSYPVGMIVSLAGVNYISLEDANQEEPGTGSKWEIKPSLASVNATTGVNFDTLADLINGVSSGGQTIYFPKLHQLTDFAILKTTSNGGAEYQLKAAAQVTADGDDIDGYVNHWLLSGTDYAAVKIKDVNITQKVDNSKSAGGLNGDEAMGMLTNFIASVTPGAPRVRGIINEKIQRAMGTDHHDFVTPESKGAASKNSIVFGSHIAWDDEPINPLLAFAVPAVAGDYALSITIEPINGSDLNDLTVDSRIWNSYETGTSEVSTIADAMSRSGSTWTQTKTLTSPPIGTVVGFQALGLTDSGSYEVAAFSITDPSGTVYKMTKKMAREVFVSLACEDDKRSVRIQEFDNGAELRTCGVLAGRVPSKVIATPDSTFSTGDLEDSYAGTPMAGFEFDYALNQHFALKMAMTFMKNGYRIPAVMLSAGTHVATTHMDIAIAPDHETEWLIACPNGIATLTEFVVGGGGIGIRIRGSEASVPGRGYVANIYCDETLTEPFIFERFHVEAYNIQSANSIKEGLESDYCDLTCELGRFSGASNDGVNSHSTGHILLIDTDCIDNGDDGFSPHDKCTYQVYGGTFSGSGKGNIIPAFGAKGYCVGAKSSDSTGLSSRVADVSGVNDGGFVALAMDNKEPTTMFLVECSSERDNHGIVCSGINSYVYAFGTPVSDSVNGELLSVHWDSSSTSLSNGLPGMIVTSHDYVSSYSIIDENNSVITYGYRLTQR